LVLRDRYIFKKKDTRTHARTHVHVYEGESDKGSVFKDPKEPEYYIILTFSTMSHLCLTL